jgi:microcin C transport system substrate-binding protein
MHGDLKYPPDFTHFEYANPDAPKGGFQRLGAMYGFDTLNPFTLRGRAAAGAAMLYNTLLFPSADEPFSEYGLLAESVEVPTNRAWIVFNLRPEARWHDGRPVTADDVVFTFHTVMTNGHPGFRFYYGGVESVEKLGERRVRFRFRPDQMSRELPLIAGQLAILPRHYWEGRDFKATTLDAPLGSGPYRIKNLEANRFIVYERVTNYWAASLPCQRGMFNYDEIRHDYYLDDTVLLESFKGGKLDIRWESSSKNWATAYEVPALREGLLRKENIPNRRASGMQGFAFNLRRPLFADARVRRALTLAFDFEWSNRALFYGAYTRCRSFFGNCELEAAGLPGEAELAILRDLSARFTNSVPAEALTSEYAPPSTGVWSTEREHMAGVRSNLIEAARLLKEAGWRVRPGDLRLVKVGEPNAVAEPFEFEILLVQPTFERIVLPYVNRLSRLGVTARVRTVDSAQYQKRAEEFDFDMIVMSWGASLSPGNEQRGYWTSVSAGEPGSDNVAGISNPAVDEAVRLLIEAPDRASLVTRTRVLDRLLQWGHYVVPHWYLNTDRVAFWDRFGRPAVIPQNGGADAMTWWIDPARDRELESRRRGAAGP